MPVITVKTQRRRGELLELLRHELPGNTHVPTGELEITTNATRVRIVEAIALRTLEIESITT